MNRKFFIGLLLYTPFLRGLVQIPKTQKLILLGCQDIAIDRALLMADPQDERYTIESEGLFNIEGMLLDLWDRNREGNLGQPIEIRESNPCLGIREDDEGQEYQAWIVRLEIWGYPGLKMKSSGHLKYKNGSAINYKVLRKFKKEPVPRKKKRSSE
jgi:hypothetical protein